MSNFVLPSWDEMDENPIIAAAAKNIESIDTTEAVKELDEIKENLDKVQRLKQAGLTPLIAHPLTTPMNPEQLNQANANLFERAQASVRLMDQYLEGGGRVTVGEKKLLNCKADLNQLVPFKFPWAWSLYLTGTEQHWMPGELSLFDAATSFNAIRKGTPKKMLARLYMSYRYREMIFSDQILLNCYRIITNPECRQYLLRQGFESVLIKHFLADLVGVFKVKNIEIDGANILKSQYEIDGNTFKQRYLNAVNLTRDLHDFTFDTITGLEDTSKFIEQLIYLYGYVNWTMQIAPLYQMFNVLQEHQQMNLGLAKALKLLLRDIQTQTMFIRYFLQTAFDENPQVLTADFKERVIHNFTQVLPVGEQDLVSTLANTNSEYREVMSLFNHYNAVFLNDIGITCPTPLVANGAEWFSDLVHKAQPHVSLEAGLNGQGGNLNW